MTNQEESTFLTKLQTSLPEEYRTHLRGNISGELFLNLGIAKNYFLDSHSSGSRYYVYFPSDQVLVQGLLFSWPRKEFVSTQENFFDEVLAETKHRIKTWLEADRINTLALEANKEVSDISSQIQTDLEDDYPQYAQQIRVEQCEVFLRLSEKEARKVLAFLTADS